MLIRAAIAALSTLLAFPAAAYTIDGNLDDWKIDKKTYEPPAKSIKGYKVDTDSTGNSSQYVNPGWGGQAYDAEALYVDIDATKLYLALITGHNPAWEENNGRHAPGDFLIDFGRDGTFEYGFTTTAGTSFRTGITAGALYQIGSGDVRLGLFANQGTPYNEPGCNSSTQLTLCGFNAVSITGGTKVGDGNIKIGPSFTGYGSIATDTHYAYEAEIAISLFDSNYWGQKFDVQWTMLCGNDVISADPSPSVVPEPMSLALFAAGLGALGLTSRRRKPTA